ncbi:MAG: ABC transporter ATP-binding protein [Deltaproteobacteria bacterium]|nr:ABC transporter ATP-binding protein [Deltaproteobacteria bacterium]
MNLESDIDSSDQLSSKMGIRGLLLRLLPYFRPDLMACFAVCLLVLTHSVIGRFVVYLFGRAIDDGIIGKDSKLLMQIALAYFVLEIILMNLQVGISTWFAKIGNRVLFRLRDHLVDHVQSLPMAYFDKVATGRIVTRLTSDTVSLTELFNQGLLSVFSSLVSILTITFAMSLISIKMTLLTLLVAPPMVFMAFKLSDKILIAQRIAKKHVSSINAFVAETVAGVRVLQLFNQAKGQREKFHSLSGEYKKANLRAVSLYALFYPTVSLFTAISVATALYIGGALTFDGAVTTGAMISFIFHVKDFGDPLRNILEKYQLFQNSISSGERVFALLEEESEPEIASQLNLPPLLQGEIRFQNVRFKYSESLPWALDDVSFSIAAGKTLAVAGRTGSGKSTLIALLQKFRDAQGGEIFLDQLPLSRIPREQIRRRIGVVQQDVFMFRGTIKDNIGLGDPSINIEKIEWAAKEAGLTRILQMRPGGLNAEVEEKGANLSIGERQLVAFARILAFDPQILILDEATANIDSETELLLQKSAARARKGRTSVIIAHRLSTISDADLVLVLNQGQVEAIGTPQEVLPRLEARDHSL